MELFVDLAFETAGNQNFNSVLAAYCFVNISRVLYYTRSKPLVRCLELRKFASHCGWRRDRSKPNGLPIGNRRTGRGVCGCDRGAIGSCDGGRTGGGGAAGLAGVSSARLGSLSVEDAALPNTPAGGAIEYGFGKLRSCFHVSRLLLAALGLIARPDGNADVSARTEAGSERSTELELRKRPCHGCFLSLPALKHGE